MDNNPRNNMLGNLQWGTARQNTDDRLATGVVLKGERHNLARISDSDATTIRTEFQNGESGPTIAKRYGLSVKHVYRIVHGEKFRHLPGAVSPKTMAKLTPADRTEVVRLRESGWSFGKLAKRFDVAKPTIRRVYRLATKGGVIPIPE